MRCFPFCSEDVASIHQPGESNSVERLEMGKILCNRAKRTFTIVLVGEPGVGKTQFVNLVSNLLRAKANYKYVTDRKNGNTKGTISSKLYEIKSCNKVKIRILDTPGVEDPQYIPNLAQSIKRCAPAVDAILVLVNGAETRRSEDNHLLRNLCSIFPNPLSENIGFVFTNVDPRNRKNRLQNLGLGQGFANNFETFIQNPVALREKLVEVRSQGEERREYEEAVSGAHKDALNKMVRVFDWINQLQAQSTEGILGLVQDSLATA